MNVIEQFKCHRLHHIIDDAADGKYPADKLKAGMVPTNFIKSTTVYKEHLCTIK